MRTILFLLFLFPFFAVAQTNYYVSTTGNDTSNGLSTAMAWKTIQYACDNATPNSVVNILGGAYFERVTVGVSGTAGNRIVFQNYNSDVVYLDGTGTSGQDALFEISNRSYITVQGLTLQNNQQLDAQGILVEGNCQDIELRNNDISTINFSSNPATTANASRNSQPLIVYGTNGTTPIRNLIIDGNKVHDSRTGYSEALAVNGNVDGFTVTNNEVYNITNIGIDIIGHEGSAPANDQARNGIITDNLIYECKSPYATAAGIYVDGGRDLLIERNIIHDSQWGIEVGCENVGKTTSNIIVRDNFIYDNEDAAITVGGFDYPSGSGKVVNTSFLNNSCYNNDTNANGTGGQTSDIVVSYVETCLFKNNIFYSTNSNNQMMYVAPVSSTGVIFDYNLYYTSNNAATLIFDYLGGYFMGFNTYKTNASQDANSSFQNPLFVSTSDLHLATGSPAIDAGDPSFITALDETDIDGNTRLQNGRVDIGADEFGGLRVQIKVYLQGAHNGTDMATSLQTASLLPMTNPYGLSEIATSIPADVVDWVKVEVRAAADNTNVLASRAAFLRKDGQIIDLNGSLGVAFDGLTAGNYYVSVRHRNHLGVMTVSAVNLSN